MIIDSAQLAAFAAVVREGSFERAAGALHVTRSAVSQRIKQLEERVGQVLIRRATPCLPTEAGQALLRHAHQVALSEAEALQTLGLAPDAGPHIAVGVNADSLATWFVAAMADAVQMAPMTFDVHVEDQDHSAHLLREGRVMAAVTSDPQPVQGCHVVRLGTMRYLAVASPAYRAAHFPQGLDAAALAQAPVLVFNRKDGLQNRFMRRITRKGIAPPVHWIPSSHAFVDAALAGLGWGMNPVRLAQPLLDDGRLVELLPGQAVDVPLYWQCWRLDVAALRVLTAAVQRQAALSLGD